MGKLVEFLSNPGVRRDGTELDSPYYTDSVWVRWQRGKPRKMGGYRAMSTLTNGPVRSMLVDSRNGVNSAHYFSQWGVQRQEFTLSGAGGNLEDRTPIGFVPNALLTWSQAVMTSSTGGDFSALLAASAPDVDDISSDVGGALYTGSMRDNLPLTVVSDSVGPISVSGGVAVLQPFAVVYGSNGLIRNSNANDFSNSAVAGQGWTPGGSGFANEANVAGTKIIYGAPVRGGAQAPAGLFWALDAVIRMSFVGGATIWSYDTIANPTSILGKKAIVEHNGRFFWPGTDRFLLYNGVVDELPNQMNCNWFFDNLNYAARNKVWGTKIPRWGEIWWFYPRGESTECDNAIIFNYLENTWYDAVKTRSAGGLVQIFPFPIWAGAEDSRQTTRLKIGNLLVTNAQTAIGNNTLNFASTAGLGIANGQIISGHDGIPAGTTVAGVGATTVTMSNNATIIIPANTAITITSLTSPFAVNDTVTGGTSGATGVVVREDLLYLNLINVVGTFAAAEALTGPHSAAANSIGTVQHQQLDTTYQHEFGKDKIVGGEISPVIASVTSKAFGLAIGAPFAETQITDDTMTMVARFEPDFKPTGDLEFTLNGKSYANDTFRELETVVSSPTEPFVEFRSQERILTIQVETNTIGGDFQQGQVMIAVEPGDERPSTNTRSPT